MLRWLVPLALLHGLLYLVVVPPWQHYDEPTHFEYAAQLAAGVAPGLPAVALNHEIADSMYRAGFWAADYRPDLFKPLPVHLGESQRVHPPLYYSLVAIPLALLRPLAIEQQLYAARGVSLIFYVLTIVVVWRIGATVLAEEPLMQRALPLLVMLAPAFADLMTAVNSDVLMNFAVTTSLLGAVLLVRDGLRPTALALALLGVIVALLTKRTAVASVVPILLALVWALRRRPFVWWAVLLAVATIMLAFGAAALRLETVTGPGEPHAVLAARPWLAALDTGYLRLDLDAWIRSVSDPARVGGRYQVLAQVAFTSFWARFGWGSITAGPLWDALFALLAVASCAGLLVGAIRERMLLPLWQRRCIWLFFVAVTVACLSLSVRLHPLPLIELQAYVPRGRYMFWAIAPAIWLFALGLQLLLPRRWRSVGPLAIVAFFGLFDTIVWAVILVGYYYQ